MTHEKVFDVAWSGDRKPDPKTGEVPLVGDTVDLKTATWTNTIGAPLLTGFWQDTDFDPAQRAFYYVRVIEIPTPRWAAYDAVRFREKYGRTGAHESYQSRVHVAYLVQSYR